MTNTEQVPRGTHSQNQGLPLTRRKVLNRSTIAMQAPHPQHTYQWDNGTHNICTNGTHNTTYVRTNGTHNTTYICTNETMGPTTYVPMGQWDPQHNICTYQWDPQHNIHTYQWDPQHTYQWDPQHNIHMYQWDPQHMYQWDPQHNIHMYQWDPQHMYQWDPQHNIHMYQWDPQHNIRTYQWDPQHMYQWDPQHNIHMYQWDPQHNIRTYQWDPQHNIHMYQWDPQHNIPMGLRRDHNHSGWFWCYHDIHQELGQVEVPKVVHCKVPFHPVHRERKGTTKRPGITHQNMEGEAPVNKLLCKEFDTVEWWQVQLHCIHSGKELCVCSMIGVTPYKNCFHKWEFSYCKDSYKFCVVLDSWHRQINHKV